MRLTKALCKQHIGFMFKKHWIYQGKRVPVEYGVDYIKSKGIEVHDANKFVEEKFTPINYKAAGVFDPPVPRDHTHPEWKETECHIYNENNALLEALKQAQVLTKTVTIEDTLPEAIEDAARIPQPIEVHSQVKKAILMANVFDCEQVRLPKIKDPLRPAYNFTRILGIGDVRKNIITTNRLLTILERNSDGIAKERFVTPDPHIMTSFEKDGDLIQFQFKSDVLVTSSKPLKPVVRNLDTLKEAQIPDLYPVHHTISISKHNFYKFEDFYPIAEGIKSFHPHTTFLHYNKSQVHNLHGSRVLEDQVLGRGLIHSFTLASAYAKTLYGKDVTLLPKPVTIQCVQTDGCNFYLGVLQLNNLDLNGNEGTKNVWFKAPNMKLYENSGYSKAIPVLEGYNPEVYHYLHAIYKNQ